MKLRIREFREADVPELDRLARACPSGRSFRYAVLRPRDYTAIFRTLGEPVAVFVAEGSGGRILGTTAVILSETTFAGTPRRVAYVADIKVDPAARGAGISDALQFAVAAKVRQWETENGPMPVCMAVDEGNGIMHERKIADFRRAGAFDYRPYRRVAVSLFTPLSAGTSEGEYTVGPATVGDGPELVRLLEREENRYSFGTRFGMAEWANLTRRFPGLRVGDFRVLRDRRGTALGFVAVWDQESIREFRVMGLAPAWRIARPFLNSSPIAGLTRIFVPAIGESLRPRAGFLWCLPGSSEERSRALLRGARQFLRETGGGFLTLGFDAADPRRSALERFAFMRNGATIYVDPRGTDVEFFREKVLFRAEPALG